VNDPVQTPNSFSDNIFTGGGSKDVNGISQWQWKVQQPQDKDDIENAFGASLTDAGTGHTLLFSGLDRYAANGSTTVGFWYFQQPVAANANGNFSGTHTDGDLLLVVNFTVGGSNPVVAAYRWTGTDALGGLTALKPPAGTTFANVNSGPISVPWSFIDKSGFTSPQAGEFLRAGVDLNALFGANAPHYVSFLCETRSSTSTTATLSDFALGSINTIGTTYRVRPGQYSNTVTVTGVDQGTNATVVATDRNYHFGVAAGPQHAVSVDRASSLAGALVHPMSTNTATLRGNQDIKTARTAATFPPMAKEIPGLQLEATPKKIPEWIWVLPQVSFQSFHDSNVQAVDAAFTFMVKETPPSPDFGLAMQAMRDDFGSRIWALDEDALTEIARSLLGRDGDWTATKSSTAPS
jgi:hypothetical protein